MICVNTCSCCSRQFGSKDAKAHICPTCRFKSKKYYLINGNKVNTSDIRCDDGYEDYNY